MLVTVRLLTESRAGCQAALSQRLIQQKKSACQAIYIYYSIRIIFSMRHYVNIKLSLISKPVSFIFYIVENCGVRHSWWGYLLTGTSWISSQKWPNLPHTHTHTLSECLLSSWALEWQEWAPHKAPERADDLNALIHHDSPSQTHPNTPSTWLHHRFLPARLREPGERLAPPKNIKRRIKCPCHAACSTHVHISL